MEKRSIPGTGLEVSPICLGTMTFGTPVAETEAIRIVHWAIDNGINFIDTADIYEGYNRFLGSPGGVAETIVGKALKGRRQQAIVTTKVGNSTGDGVYEGVGLGRKHILHQIECSLMRLQTDHVDFYELHRPDPDTPMSETIALLANLITEGKIRHWGFSNFEAGQVREMVDLCDEGGWPRPVISQPPYSWLKRDEETEHLPACRDNQISITPYRSLEAGLLTGKYRRGQPPPLGSRAEENPDWAKVPDDALSDRLESFETEARVANLQPVQYAVKWVLDQPGVSSVVVGAKRIEQLETLISW